MAVQDGPKLASRNDPNGRRVGSRVLVSARYARPLGTIRARLAWICAWEGKGMVELEGLPALTLYFRVRVEKSRPEVEVES